MHAHTRARTHTNCCDGGWQTARHYAVPTTDVAVAAVPRVRDWFNARLQDSVFPALEELYAEGAAVGAAGAGLSRGQRIKLKRGSLRVHDAFVVKYDAGPLGGGAAGGGGAGEGCGNQHTQRGLPIHTDQVPTL